ncbi:MAG: cupin domain-containing protein [Novosphingobium sp.]|nr:cupin domain-containing protein [Novosphingobium sp.]
MRPTPARTVAVLAAACCLIGARNGELPDALLAGWKGRPTCELLSQSATNRVLKCTFKPGTGHERHFHPVNFGYALSGGVMRLTDAKGIRVATIKTGSSFSSAGTEWHEAVNIGKTTVAYLIVEEWPARPQSNLGKT